MFINFKLVQNSYWNIEDIQMEIENTEMWIFI